MPGTFEPGQMYDHELNQKKGWPSPYAVDVHAKVKDEESGIYAGSVISLDANSEFVLALSSDTAMAVFALQNQTDPDVRSDKGNLAGDVASGLAAVGALELQTTEFVADTYVPNDPLTVESTGDNKGKLKKGTVYTDPIVGVVSLGESDSEHNATIKFLAFWPVWLPPAP